MSTETAVESREKVEDVSPLGRIVGVFTSPAKTFASIDVNPGWLLPILVMIGANLIFTYFAGDIVLQERLAQQEQALLDSGLDQEQIDQRMAIGQSIGKWMGYGISVVGPFLAVVVVSAVFMFVGNTILGGQTTFKKLMSVTAHSWLILSLYYLILLPLVISQETALVTFSLASLLPDQSATTFLYQVLLRVDLFSIWCIVVYSIGLGVIYKMKTQKMATAVVAVYAIYTLAAAGLSGLFS